MSDKKSETNKTDKPSDLGDADLEKAVGGRSSVKANTSTDKKHVSSI